MNNARVVPFANHFFGDTYPVENINIATGPE